MRPGYRSIGKGLLLAGILWSGGQAAAATFDWSSTGWNDGDTSGSFTDVDGSGIDVTVTVTPSNAPYQDNTPKLDDDSSFWSSGLGHDHLEEDLDFNSSTQSVTTTFKFSVPVKLSSLIWRDIDAMNDGSNLFDDKIIITAKDTDGNTIYPNNAQLGSNIQDDGYGAYEAKDNNKNYSPEDAEATLQVDLNSTYVTEFSYTYTSGDGIRNGDNPTQQATWFDNFNFEPKDTDGDGVPDFQDIDDDGDGILDSVEIQGGGTCAYGFFHVIGGQLNILDPENGGYIPIGATHSDIVYNGMGYDATTGNLYAVARDDGTDDDGTSVSTGDIIEINRYSGKVKKYGSSQLDTYAADFYNGKLYGRVSTTEVDAWDKANDSVSTVQSGYSPATKWADFAILPDSNSHLIAYGMHTNDTTSGDSNNTDFYRLDLNSGSASKTALTVTTPDGQDLALGWGAAFISKKDGAYHLYVSNNNGYIYEINNFVSGTPTATFAYHSEVTNKNDGASCRDANQYAVDTDGDGIPDYLDLDSDNDGIPDNVEAQSTGNYTAPSGTDADGDGLDDAYDAYVPTDGSDGAPGSMGLIPPDKDGDGYADFVDTDSDNDGYGDCEEGQSNSSKTCSADGKTATGTFQGNGLVDWAGSDGYTDVNGNVNDPTSDLLNETGDTSEVAYREFLCGKGLIKLTAYHWRMISMPCQTGDNTIQELFRNDLGDYGEPSQGGHWVMYAQSASTGSDSDQVTSVDYEVGGSRPKNTPKTKLTADSTVKQGVSYWIITDDDHNVTIPRDLDGLAPTPTTDANDSSIGINNDFFSKVHNYSYLPDNDMRGGGESKKFMAGNPFPFSFHLSHLYFAHDPGNGSFHPMGNSDNDSYINAVVYVHDSADTTDQSVENGGGYKAIDPSTPGFGGAIQPMEGFFVKILDGNGDTAQNAFAFPLTYGNDK